MSATKEALKTVEEGQGEPSLLEEITQATRLKPADEAYSLTRKGVEALLAQLLVPGKEAVKVSKSVVDDMIATIDKKLSAQLDAILHHQKFQQLESAWRSLKFLVDRTDFAKTSRSKCSTSPRTIC